MQSVSQYNMQIKVEEDKSLVRDSSNGAILNTNKKALEEYRRNRNHKLSLQKQVDDLAKQVEQLTQLILNNNKSQD